MKFSIVIALIAFTLSVYAAPAPAPGGPTTTTTTPPSQSSTTTTTIVSCSNMQSGTTSQVCCDKTFLASGLLGLNLEGLLNFGCVSVASDTCTTSQNTYCCDQSGLINTCGPLIVV